jgi:hypothetical protein
MSENINNKPHRTVRSKITKSVYGGGLNLRGLPDAIKYTDSAVRGKMISAWLEAKYFQESNNPFHAISSAYKSLEANVPLNPAIREWLMVGFGLWLSTGGKKDLNDSWDLKGYRGVSFTSQVESNIRACNYLQYIAFCVAQHMKINKDRPSIIAIARQIVSKPDKPSWIARLYGKWPMREEYERLFSTMKEVPL